jgi:glycosyltransferase involved in cell wall biosynthesis
VLDAVARLAPALRVVVIDDGSSDATGAIARARGAIVLRHPINLGYGAALQTGYKYALRCGAARVAQMDADGQHDPADLPRLLAALERGEADLVIGSRFLDAGDYQMDALRSAGRMLFRSIAGFAGLRVTDPTSGFQALGARVLELYASELVFPSDFPDVDVLLSAHRRGIRVAECAVRMHPSARESTLHAGWRPLYYVYKMLLSLWARR